VLEIFTKLHGIELQREKNSVRIMFTI